MTSRMLYLGLSLLFGANSWAQSPLNDLTEDDLAEGQNLFRVHCARCHGIDGEGGEGSNLARPVLRYAPDDESLIALMGDGIPGTAMPAIWFLSAEEAPKLAGYVKSLGRIAEEEMPGDPQRGEKIYQTSGGCPVCHIVAGKGEGIGPELTTVGESRGLDYLRQSLLDPASAQSRSSGFQDYLTVRAIYTNGQIEGMRINEDAFSIQVRDVGGTVHSLRKDELEGLEKIYAHSLMPEYATALSPQEIDDLISYLMSLRSDR